MTDIIVAQQNDVSVIIGGSDTLIVPGASTADVTVTQGGSDSIVVPDASVQTAGATIVQSISDAMVVSTDPTAVIIIPQQGPQGPAGAGGGTLATLTDVNVTEGAGIDGYLLQWNNATGKWVATSLLIRSGTLIKFPSDTTQAILPTAAALGWDDGTGTVDTTLSRDAFGTVAVGAIPGNTQSELRVYADYTDAANYDGFQLLANNFLVKLAAVHNGTGTLRGFSIEGLSITFKTTASGAQHIRWTLDQSGFLTAGSLAGTITLPVSNGAQATANFPPGTAPTTPNDGDMWYDGIHLYFAKAGVPTIIT